MPTEEGKTYAVGDTGPAGGLIFYAKNSKSDGWRYLEAAPSNQSDGIRWADGNYIAVGGTSTAVGTGKANTEQIVSILGDGTYAAKLCADLVLGGKSDWFLPSEGEALLMETNLVNNDLGDFTAGYHWTSSEINAGSAQAWYPDVQTHTEEKAIFLTSGQFDGSSGALR